MNKYLINAKLNISGSRVLFNQQINDEKSPQNTCRIKSAYELLNLQRI